MNNFEQSKFNITSFIQQLISGRLIVSYGFITDISPDFVTVTAAVSDSTLPLKIRCTYMNLGNELFSIHREPEIGTRVLVLSPNKAADGMYKNYEQILEDEGRSFILTGALSSYSSQFAMCIPIMEVSSLAKNRLMVDDELLSLFLTTEFSALIDNHVEVDLTGNSSIELHEGTEHFRGCYGNMEQTFGMVQGIGGTEKEGDYTYKETYGKFSSVEKNYESGAKVTVGKAYETPFLDSKGILGDSSAPVTIDLGAGAPVTLTFGESIMTIKADTTAGIDIAVTGALPVKIIADAGLLKFGNSIGSLASVLNELFDALGSLGTVGGPTQQTVNPATVAAIEAVRAKVITIFE